MDAGDWLFGENSAWGGFWGDKQKRLEEEAAQAQIDAVNEQKRLNAEKLARQQQLGAEEMDLNNAIQAAWEGIKNDYKGNKDFAKNTLGAQFDNAQNNLTGSYNKLMRNQALNAQKRGLLNSSAFDQTLKSANKTEGEDREKLNQQLTESAYSRATGDIAKNFQGKVNNLNTKRRQAGIEGQIQNDMISAIMNDAAAKSNYAQALGPSGFEQFMTFAKDIGPLLAKSQGMGG